MIRKITEWHLLPQEWGYTLECGHTSGYDTFDNTAKERIGDTTRCYECERLEEAIAKKVTELEALKSRRRP